MFNLISNSLIFLINYFKDILIIMFTIIILYSWIDMIINNPFKDIKEYYKLYNTKDINELIENIKYMDGREFEEFCTLLFKKTGKYKSIELTDPTHDGGKDIILTDMNDKKIYIECKRYTNKATKTEDYMIGREICQKLVGAMVGDGITKGFIITTGNVHQNAWDYIYKLKQNQKDISIDILNLNDIKNMLINIKNKHNKQKVLLKN